MHVCGILTQQKNTLELSNAFDKLVRNQWIFNLPEVGT